MVADELRGRGSRAPIRSQGGGLAPDPLALLSAFCAAGQSKMGAAPQAKKIWWPVADERRGQLRGRESRTPSGLGTESPIRFLPFAPQVSPKSGCCAAAAPAPAPPAPQAAELQSGKFGLRMKKVAHIKPILCVFGMLFYSSGYTAPEMHHQQANVIQTTRAGAWPVWLIW